MNVLVDIFRDIVAGVSKDVGYMVNYQFGDWQYMAKTLSAMGKAPVTAGRKYPMIGLYSPFDEDKGPGAIVSHVKTDNFRYGRAGVYGEGKSEFDDRIDAIDIKDLRLNVKNITCR